MRIKLSNYLLFKEEKKGRQEKDVTILTLKQREGDNLKERLITKVVSSEKKDNIRTFVKKHVTKDTTIFSDCGSAYTTLCASYDLTTVNHSKCIFWPEW